MSQSRTLFIAVIFVTSLSCAFAVSAPSLRAQVTGTSPVLATPPVAAQGANGHLDPEAATQGLSRHAAGRQEGQVRRVLRGRLLADPVGLRGGRRGVPHPARHGAVGANAQCGRAHDRERATLQSVIYWVEFIVLVSVVELPWSIYEGFVREHSYGLSNLTFGAWLGEQAKGLLIALVVGAILSLRCCTRSCGGCRARGGCGERSRRSRSRFSAP